MHTEFERPHEVGFERAERIREEYRAGNITIKELARRYKFSRRTISDIINNHSWKEPLTKHRNKAKLSMELADELRELFYEEGWSRTDLAAKFNVSIYTVTRVAHWRSWDEPITEDD